MEGSIAKQEIAKLSAYVDDTCNYCEEADSTVNHIRWQRNYFEPQRRELGPDLAAVPLTYPFQCIQCGIAPAMKVDLGRTY